MHIPTAAGGGDIHDVASGDASQVASAERQQLLARMLSRLAHEIRNPLGSLDVHVQLLEEDLASVSPPISSRITGRLSIIRTELHRLDGVVRQFLNLARPFACDAQPIDIAQTVRQVSTLLKADAAARRIELVTTIPDGLPFVPADAGQLNQALVNLVINAIQAMGSGGRVEIEIRLEQPPEWVCIDVRDCGPGIDASTGATIFEPFFTTKAEGSGLGLWIVQQIALAHGGTIAATNLPRGGALFSLRLPVPRETVTP